MGGDLQEVIPGLYYGGDIVALTALLEADIGVVVNVGWYGSSFKGVIEGMGGKWAWLHFPLLDSPFEEDIDLRYVCLAVNAVITAYAEGFKVYVHCQAGENRFARSALVVGLVLRALGYTPGVTIAALRNPKALNNKLFWKLVWEGENGV